MIQLRPITDEDRAAVLGVEYFREPGITVVSTSAGRGEGSPIPFYERYGFKRTGDIVFDGEVLLELRLR